MRCARRVRTALGLVPKGQFMDEERSKRRTIGFTLIELLVVVAIISLLVSILLPSLARAKDLARASICASNLRHIGLGLLLFSEENEGEAPDMIAGGGGWTRALLPYLGQSNEDFIYERDSVGGGWLNCPMETEPDDFAYDTRWPNGRYAMNYPVVTAYEPEDMAGHTGGAVMEKLPAEVLVVCDSATWIIYTPYIWRPIHDADDDGLDDSFSMYENGARAVYKYNGFRPRHLSPRDPRWGYVVFADWHVAPVTLEQWLDNDGELWGTWTSSP